MFEVYICNGVIPVLSVEFPPSDSFFGIDEFAVTRPSSVVNTSTSACAISRGIVNIFNVAKKR